MKKNKGKNLIVRGWIFLNICFQAHLQFSICFGQLIKAEDTGGLSSTATVNIKVTDINDKNPEFDGLPYEFTVKEGEARKLIGRVHADDADEGINAEVTYFAPDDIPFTVEPKTGDVLTKIALDYEQNHVGFFFFIFQLLTQFLFPSCSLLFFYSRGLTGVQICHNCERRRTGPQISYCDCHGQSSGRRRRSSHFSSKQLRG